MPARTLIISFGRSDPAAITSVERWTWRELVTWLRRRLDFVAPAKDAAGWYCPAEFEQPHRHGMHYIARHAITFDIDQADCLTLDEVRSGFANREYVCYTTWSHKDSYPRYRIVLPLSRPCGHDEFQAVARSVADNVGLDTFAKESFRPVQMMYAPAAREGQKPDFWHHAGAWVDVDAELATYEDWTDRSAWPKRSDEDHVSEGGEAVSPLSKPGIVGDFCRAYRITDAIQAFALPYEPTEHPFRYTYTKGTRPEGVVIYDDATKIHSHNGTDPAHGQHNAFDLVRLHRFGHLDTPDEAAKPITERASFRAMAALAAADPKVSRQAALSAFEDLGDPAPEDAVATPAGRPTIVYPAGRPLTKATEAARAAIIERAEAIGVATYGSRFVRPIVTLTRAGFAGVVESVELLPVEVASFSALLGKEIDFAVSGKEGAKRVDCPPMLAKALLNTADVASAITIDRVAMTPILVGTTLHARRGHDRALRAWLLAPEGLTLPDMADPRNAAVGALERVQAWLAEFPFDGAVDRACALAALLTAAMRASLEHAPGFLISKPDYGSGASTLCDLIHVVLAGRPAPVINASAGRGEVDKGIDATQLAGLPAIVIDNVVDGECFNSVALAQALSQSTRQVRILGESRVLNAPCTQMALVNGNNVRIADDLIRRFLRIRLEPRMENPHTREFRRPTLIHDAQAERKALLTDLYTITVAYRLSGAHAHVAPLAGYSDWSEAVAAPLVWLGCPDVTETQKSISAEDERRGSLREILTAWRAVYGGKPITVRGVIEEEFPEEGRGAETHELRRMLADIAASPRGGMDATRLGKWLQGVAGKVVGGLHFELAGTAHGGVKKWRVVDDDRRWLD